MKVSELIEALKKMPQDMDVYSCYNDECFGDCDEYINGVYVVKSQYTEESYVRVSCWSSEAEQKAEYPS